MKKALIVAAGNTDGLKLSLSYDLVIAADGGYDNAVSLGLTPDVFVGDMDSVKAEISDVEKIRLQVEKDFTDTEAAISLAVERGYEKIDIIGAIGSRFDHSMANACLLKKYADCDAELRVLDSNNEVFVVKGNKLIKGRKGETISLLPLDSKVSGISLKGFYYPLENAEAEIGTTLMVSNVIISDEAKISIKEGVALAIIARD